MLTNEGIIAIVEAVKQGLKLKIDLNKIFNKFI